MFFFFLANQIRRCSLHEYLKTPYLTEVTRDLFGNYIKGYSVFTSQAMMKRFKSAFPYLNEQLTVKHRVEKQYRYNSITF